MFSLSHFHSAVRGADRPRHLQAAPIARNVQEAAHGTAEVAINIGDVSRGAVEIGAASAQVLSSAKALSGDSLRLRREVERFLDTVRAA